MNLLNLVDLLNNPNERGGPPQPEGKPIPIKFMVPVQKMKTSQIYYKGLIYDIKIPPKSKEGQIIVVFIPNQSARGGGRRFATIRRRRHGRKNSRKNANKN